MRLHDVDLPQPIIDAQKRGKLVLFAGAGVSIDAPSNYPNFVDLATEIGGPNFPRNENELIDRYLGRLEQQGRAVHERVKRLLSDPNSRPNHLHQTLVRIFGASDAIRIVTTNFDDHFFGAATEVFGRPPKSTHRELAAQFGHQADHVVAEARVESHQSQQPEPEIAARQAATYARNHVFERSAVQDERTILQSMLDRGMGQVSYGEARSELAHRVATGEFRSLGQREGHAALQYTTGEMVRMEREIIERMQAGNRRTYSDPMLVSPQLRIKIEDRHPELNSSQYHAVDEIFLSREKMIGLEGVAGAGKTTALAVIREGALADGYRVEGFAPTSRAAQKLAKAGIETSTLQKHLARGEQPDTGVKRLYVLDESSLASTRQMYEFVQRLHRNDRVLLVGDTRQHESVEAGRPFAQLQEAGMLTVRLDQILRQRDPELKEAVEQLSRGEVRAAIQNLDIQRRVHEISSCEERIGAIAREYARSPEGALVVSPDNRSRAEINEHIHRELQSRGIVKRTEHSITTLVPRQEMTGADRTWAARYEVNDILRYSRSSRETGIARGEYARVTRIDGEKNLLTVTRADGAERTYDPRRQMGVTVYREQEKVFSVGDRIQFTAPDERLKVANRELGTVERATEIGLMRLRMDTGREITFDSRRHPHLDHGYAVTSHASQGQTAERVLIHVDTELGAKDLLNHRMAYVSISRGQYDAQIFTNDLGMLSQALSHDVSHQIAYKPEQAIATMQQKIAPSPAHEVEQGFGLALGM